ncbi:Gfo/Idh/MocA family oxidoreductase [Williamsia maris]
MPSVRAIDGLELVAVATRRQDSADAAARAFGAHRAYADPRELIDDPAVDIVTVAASVPAHHDLIVAAAAAGKHVYTEWPVGISTAETEAMVALDAPSLRHSAVGLQARRNPAVVVARDIISSGAVGRTLAVSVLSTTAGFGRSVSTDELYLENPETGMNLATIQAAHTIDLVRHLAGPIDSLSAQTTIQFPVLAVDGGPGVHQRTVPDHVAAVGRLADSGALTAEIVGGRPADDTPFRLSIVGEKSTLVLRGGAARGFQAGSLVLELDGRTVDLPDGPVATLPDSVVNVAGIYSALRDDIVNETHTAPGFEDALELNHLMDAIGDSARHGTRSSTSS